MSSNPAELCASLPLLRLARRAAKQITAVSLSAAMLALSASGCKAQAWPLWDSYTARYLDNQGRVIDHTAGDKSTSEGESYAMFFSLVVGDRARFDKLVNWTEANLAGGDLTARLPAWSWGKAPDGSWRVLDPNPAADADLWMAYSLSEAGRLWHVDRYSKLGASLASRIAHEEVALIPAVGSTLLPGREGFHPTTTSWYINPSYMPPSLLAYFAQAAPDSPWSEVLASLPAVTRTSGGFAMDWLVGNTDTGVMPSPPPSVMATLPQDQTPPMPLGSYDAIRVYLWAGIAAPRTPHLEQEIASLGGMSAYLSKNAIPPLQVGPEGQIVNPNGAVGFSAAVIPYLQLLGRKKEASAQSDRLKGALDPASGLYGKDGMYYDQNLVLFAEGWSTGRYSFDQHGQLHVKWKS